MRGMEHNPSAETLDSIMRPRLLLADDHALVREALATILQPDFEIVGIAEDTEALLARARRLRPDVVLLEMQLPGEGGLAAVRALQARQPELRCVFVTGRADLRAVREAFAAGAAAYVLKDATPDELIAAVWSAVRGETHVSPALELDPSSPPEPGPAMREGSGELTPRQREVLLRVAAGMSCKQVAEDLGISVKTVEFHRTCIARQLGLRTTAALTRYAVAQGLVEAPPKLRA